MVVAQSHLWQLSMAFSRHKDGAPVTGMELQSQGWNSRHRDAVPVTGMELQSQGWNSRHRDAVPVTGMELQSQGWNSRHKGGESIFQKPFMAVAGWRNYIVGCTDRARFILPG